MTEGKSLIREFLQASQNGHVLLLYYGMMSREIREHLMGALKYNLAANGLVPPRYRKRAYSIADECINNIFQYYASAEIPLSLTGISVYKKNHRLDFIFTNSVKLEDKDKLEAHLKKLYNRPPEKLREAFVENISNDDLPNEDKAGLGLIIVSQRALGNFDFHFENQKDGNFLFHLKIALDLD